MLPRAKGKKAPSFAGGGYLCPAVNVPLYFRNALRFCEKPMSRMAIKLCERNTAVRRTRA
jgi:hypothetical protein